MLKKGEVLAFKTDTVWGFGCEVDDIEAVNKIKRPFKVEKPIINDVVRL